MNALSTNANSEGRADVGAYMPRPQAVLAISAHGYIPGRAVSANRSSRTIRHFGGIPQELYEVKYQTGGEP